MERNLVQPLRSRKAQAIAEYDETCREATRLYLNSYIPCDRDPSIIPDMWTICRNMQINAWNKLQKATGGKIKCLLKVPLTQLDLEIMKDIGIIEERELAGAYRDLGKRLEEAKRQAQEAGE
jgi:hypothetical protein